MDRAHNRPSASGRRRCAVSRPPSHGGQRLARSPVGTHRTRTSGEVLPADDHWSTSTHSRADEMGALLGSGRPPNRRRRSAAMSARDWPRLRRLFRLPTTAARVRADVDKELHFHIEGRIEELMTSGLTRVEAEREARRRFGDYGRIESEVERLDLATHRRRDVQDRLEALRADFAYTVRVLAKQPVFAGVVVVTLTLAIAATTSIFHAVDRVVLNPLPYPEPGRIVYLGWHWAKGGGGADALSPRSFQFWHDNSQVFDGLATVRSFEAVVGESDQSTAVRGARLSADYLRVVRATPMIGRAFAPEEYVD